MKILAAAALALVTVSGASTLDVSTAKRIAILHDGRVKPLDTFAREMLRALTGKERFTGYRDPVTDQHVAVFGDADPVETLFRLVAEPQRFRELNFIRIDHPGLKAQFHLDEARLFFSLRDFDACREEIKREKRRIDPEEATSAQRALLGLITKQEFVEAIFDERILTIVPVAFGETGGWMTPGDVQIYLSGTHPTDPRFRAVTKALATFLEGDARPAREAALRKVVTEYERVKAAVQRSDSGAFKPAVIELEAALRSVNPGEYPSPEEIDRELWYQQLNPFGWASNLFLLAVVVFSFAYAFHSRAVWMVALGTMASAIGMTAYGYGLRWVIADRYPLSNHYESMIMVAFAAGVVSLIAELILRRRVFGLAGAIGAFVMILLAQNVGTFAEQASIRNVQPALQTFWMTIHVPVIMTGYAGGLIICVLGHLYLLINLFRRPSTEKTAEMEKLDDVMYRALQVTVLFLLAGVLLGAVWAGEAWGRPWGWDMKEVWALITLVAYIATLHGRFTGKVRGMGTALCAIVCFMLVILCYYGVNFLFGRGLHTYGFGSGEVWPVVVFFAAEAALMGVASAVEIVRRRDAPVREATPE